MSNINVSVIIDKKLTLGEGPHWLETDQSLLFVDIPAGDVYRFYTKTNRLQKLHIESSPPGLMVSLVVPVEEKPDQFVVTLGRRVVKVHWSSSDPDEVTVKNYELIASVEDELGENRFNDGKCDPLGRLWAGTMRKDNIKEHPVGAFYSFDHNYKAKQLIDKVFCSNGLAWDEKKKVFYYIDSLLYCVHKYDYDEKTGCLRNRRVVFDFKKAGLDPDVPDGMTIDTDGNLWIACYYGYKVICVNPETAEVLMSVPVPSRCVTSVCWGGIDYGTLYVTTSSIEDDEEEIKRSPHSGKTFAITALKAKGFSAYGFKSKN